MKVYRVRSEVNRYQYFMLEDEEVELSEMMLFDGTPKGENWIAPDVYIFQPKLKKGNFLELWGSHTFVVDEAAFDQLQDLLEMSGELLPLKYKDSVYHVLNVTECFNVLNEKKTKWLFEKGSEPIEKYAFHSNRFTESPLFKIPETCKSEILTIEGLKDPEDEFKGRVEQLGLKGLIFEELWSDEQ